VDPPSGAPMIERRAGSLWLAVAAAFLALVALLGPAAGPAAAATDSLALTTSTTYTLVPERHVVRVSIDVTAQNNKPNLVLGGGITRYFYDSFRIGVQTEARSFKATSGGASLHVSTTPADGYTTVEVRFRNSLFYHQTANVRVTFDLPGGAPRSKSEVRVGPAFATFVAWAFGNSGSVRIVLPKTFDSDSTGAEVTKSTAGQSTVLSATNITDVPDWYVVVNADRKSALTSDRISLPGGEKVVIHAWPDDPTWKTQVSDLLSKGLPELVGEIGLPWPVLGDLSIFEVHTALLEGYAGIFFEGENRIEVSEDLDDLTILHETSHAWFNTNLFVGRWINEGLADTYASRSLDAIGLGGWAPGDVDPTDKAAVKLNDWVFPGRITDNKTDAREQFGYDASWTVVRSIVSDVGADGMRAVLKAADNRQIAYVGASAPETVAGPNDWRRLLDLVDEIGKAKTADDLFRRWVASPDDLTLMDERAAARTVYAKLVADGGAWLAPVYVRRAMSDWSFSVATTRIAEAEGVLAKRDQIAGLSGALGVTPPSDLQTAYQAADGSLDTAEALADRENGDLQAVQAATAAVDAPRDPIVALGLMGTAPEARLNEARAAFSRGATDTAAHAVALTALIAGAADVGRARLIAAGLVAIVIAFGLVVSVLVVRRRRLASRAAFVVAGAALLAPTDPDPTTPYATLADPPSESADESSIEPSTDAPANTPSDRGDEP